MASLSKYKRENTYYTQNYRKSLFSHGNFALFFIFPFHKALFYICIAFNFE
jgi:hypothetical protein